MKKLFQTIFLLCITAIVASAQWKVESVSSSEPNTTLLQVLETENSTLVYATLVVTLDHTQYLTLNRNTCVKVNGLKYKVINSVNLPIGDEADYRTIYLSEGHNVVNFVMEFEKFPVEDGFDIIESTKEGDWNFNFHGVKVSPIEQSKVIDTERFLNSESPVIAGKYTENGTNYLYYIREDVCVTCNAVVQSGGLFTDDEIFYVSIVNNSDHGVMFDYDKVRVIGTRTKKGQVETESWVKYTPDSYDSYLAQMDYDEARRNSAGIFGDLGDQIDREKRNTEHGSWERLGWEALGALNQQAIQNRINDYLENHPKDRPTGLKSTGIKSDESIHGYIASKRKKKCDTVDLIIPMDGYDFTFTYNLSR